MKYNVTELFKEKELIASEKITLTESNYKKVFQQHALTLFSSLSTRGNIITKPPIFLYLKFEDKALKALENKVKKSNFSLQIKQFILDFIKDNRVAYIASTYFPKMPVVGIKEQDYLILNAIQKAFGYIIDNDIKILDDTKVEQLFKYAYLNAANESYFYKALYTIDKEALYYLFKNLFIDSIGISSAQYERLKDEIGNIFIHYAYNYNLIPTYPGNIRVLQKEICELNEINYKELDFIPTFSNLLYALEKSSLKLNYMQTLFRLQKIHYWLPLMLSCGYGLFNLYLQTYMHISDLKFPKLLTIAPITSLQKNIKLV